MSPPYDYDLLVWADRVLCVATGLDGPGAVAVRGDRIAAAGAEVDGSARREIDIVDGVLMPGLVDLHAHPGNGGPAAATAPSRSRYGIDADAELLARGTTTVMSQGDAGADNWPAYRHDVVDASRTRVRMALHLSRRGETDPDCPYGSLEDADVGACVAAIASDPQLIWGIAMNTSTSIGLDPQAVMERGLQAAEESGTPILFGTRMQQDWPLDEQLPLLRPGDVVTYCFNPLVEGAVEAGRLRRSVWEARERGVLFDIGHGMASFSYAVAEPAIGEGFLPDTISSDQYLRHVGSQPQHDLALTMSKVIAAGMSERDAVERVTVVPARLLGLEGEVGTLAPGSCADLVVLHEQPHTPLVDVEGAERIGTLRQAGLVVRAGQVMAERQEEVRPR